MNLRKEIESFALWYIPLALLAKMLPSMVHYYSKVSNPDHLKLAVITEATLLPYHLLAFIIGFWLFFQVKKQNGRAVLWLFFGLVANLFSVLFYFLIRYFESQKEHQKTSA